MTFDMVPQTRMQWMGFVAWAMTILTVEWVIGKKKPLGASSVFELIFIVSVIAIIITFRRNNGDK